MPSHLSAFDLFMWQHERVPPQNKREIEQHLQNCPACTAYVATHVSFVRNRRPAAFPSAPAVKQENNGCVPPDKLGMFVLNELSEAERKSVEKHCALCDPCREQLAEVIRALDMPMRESEKAYLASNPPLDLEIHLRQILDLAGQQPHGFVEILKQKIPAWPSAIRWKPALGFAVFLLCALSGWWLWPRLQYHFLVQESAKAVAQQYPVYFIDDLRPTGAYHATDIKELMHPEAMPAKDPIEQKLHAALAYKDDGAAARQILAQYHLKRGNLAPADSLLRLLEAASPRNAGIRNDRGLWHFARHDYEAAAQAFVQAYAWDSRLEAALYNLAITQKQLGQIAAARATWQEYLSLKDIALEWRKAAEHQLRELENPH